MLAGPYPPPGARSSGLAQYAGRSLLESPEKSIAQPPAIQGPGGKGSGQRTWKMSGIHNNSNNQMNNNQIGLRSECRDRLENGLKEGWYGKPHILTDMVKERLISKSAYLLLDHLLALENRPTKNGGRFYRIDEMICVTGLMTSKTLVSARRELISKGIIEYTRGYSSKASEYEILLDKGQYFRGGKKEN